jgi:hypothetical protein
MVAVVALGFLHLVLLSTRFGSVILARNKLAAGPHLPQADFALWLSGLFRPPPPPQWDSNQLRSLCCGGSGKVLWIHGVPHMPDWLILC